MKGGKLIGEMRLVKKEELPLLIQGKRYDEIVELPFEDIGQGYGYKNTEAYEGGADYICYIPEYCYDQDTFRLDVDCCYSKMDFLELTGNEEMARELFYAVDWQHPSSLWGEWENCDEEN